MNLEIGREGEEKKKRATYKELIKRVDVLRLCVWFRHRAAVRSGCSPAARNPAIFWWWGRAMMNVICPDLYDTVMTNSFLLQSALPEYRLLNYDLPFIKYLDCDLHNSGRA